MTRQYFYRVNDCRVLDSNDPLCICWHDEGTGPLGKLSEYVSSWRDKPEIAANPETKPPMSTLESLVDSEVRKAVRAERDRCIHIVENYQVPIGNSIAGEKAREMTLDALRIIRDEIQEGQ